MSGDVFKKAVEEASALSPAERDEIGALILLEIQDEVRWSKTFAKSQEALSKMAADALRDMDAGETQPMNLKEPKDLAS